MEITFYFLDKGNWMWGQLAQSVERRTRNEESWALLWFDPQSAQSFYRPPVHPAANG